MQYGCFATELENTLLYMFIVSLGSAVCTNPQCVRAAVHILDHVDPSIDPCDNFYKFACGTFLKQAFLRKKATSLATLSDLTRNHLKEIITETKNETDVPNSLVVQQHFNRYLIWSKVLLDNCKLSFKTSIIFL